MANHLAAHATNGATLQWLENGVHDGTPEARRATASMLAAAMSAEGAVPWAGGGLRELPPEGLVFVEDLLALGPDAQVRLLEALREGHQRVLACVGSSMRVQAAVQDGSLHPALFHRLGIGQIDATSVHP